MKEKRAARRKREEEATAENERVRSYVEQKIKEAATKRSDCTGQEEEKA